MSKRVAKPKLVTIAYSQIKAYGPCYDPIKHIPEAWEGTVLDILRMKGVSPQDKLWAMCRDEFIDPGLLRRFAVAQAKTCRKHVKNKKKFDRILRVCLRFADGKASADDLSAARNAARNAAESAAESEARNAAESAAESEAWSAAVKMLIKLVRGFYAK